MQELPETGEGTAQWCKDVFVTKVLTNVVGKSFCRKYVYSAT